MFDGRTPANRPSDLFAGPVIIAVLLPEIPSRGVGFFRVVLSARCKRARRRSDREPRVCLARRKKKEDAIDTKNGKLGGDFFCAGQSAKFPEIYDVSTVEVENIHDWICIVIEVFAGNTSLSVSFFSFIGFI